MGLEGGGEEGGRTKGAQTKRTHHCNGLRPTQRCGGALRPYRPEPPRCLSRAPTKTPCTNKERPQCSSKGRCRCRRPLSTRWCPAHAPKAALNVVMYRPLRRGTDGSTHQHLHAQTAARYEKTYRPRTLHGSGDKKPNILAAKPTSSDRCMVRDC